MPLVLSCLEVQGRPLYDRDTSVLEVNKAEQSAEDEKVKSWCLFHMACFKFAGLQKGVTYIPLIMRRQD